ncbi:MAG: T9SS type A sorting domain-containing protein [Bacteroidales bacterium]
MKTRIVLIFLLLIASVGSLVTGQSANLTNPFIDETDARSNTNVIILQLTGDTLLADIASDDIAAAIFLGGMSGGSAAWDSLVGSLNAGNITLLNNNLTAHISVPSSTSYYIVSDDTITFTIPSASLKSGGDSIVATPEIVIANELSAISGDGGDLAVTATESDIRSRDNSYSLELDNNLWNSDITGSADLLDTIKGMFSGGTVFPSLVDALTLADLEISVDGKILGIYFRQNLQYFIETDEVISVEVSNSLLSFEEFFTDSVQEFTITNEIPYISITAKSLTEAEIRSGSTDFDITLNGDQWSGSLGSNFAEDIVSGGNWDTQITPFLTFNRISDTVVTVTIPETSGFDIINEETVQVTVSATALQHTSAGSFTASEEMTITPEPVIIIGSATFNGVNEGDIRVNSYTITLTLYEDTWHGDIGGDNSRNRDLINSLTFTPTESVAAGVMKAEILQGGNDGADNTTVSGNVVTITVPEVAAFNIQEDVQVSFAVPSSALVNSSTTVNTGDFAFISHIVPTMEISSDPDPLYESDLNKSIIGVKLFEEEWFDNNLDKSNFNLIVTPSAAGISIKKISRFGSDSCEIELQYDGIMSTNHTIDLSINAVELKGSDPITGAISGIPVIALIEPVILDVVIPDVPMGIGDIVTAQITVDDDNDFVFDSIVGTIAGRVMIEGSLVRISETLYTADFEIIEDSEPQYAGGDDIVVDSLQMFNDTVPGNYYSGVISQSNDLIDSKRPVIGLVSFNNGKYRIGQSLVATIQSAESNLTFDENLTSINTIPLTDPGVVAYNAGSGIYQLTYTVAEGDPDVVSPAAVPVNIVLRDGVLNSSLVATSYSGADPEIDANSPVITTVDETSTGTQVPGNSIVHTITATENGLLLGSGTTVNNVGVGSGRISLAVAGENTYQLVYEVSADDSKVSSGNLMVTLSLADSAGNETVFGGTITNKDLSIVTSSPTADMYGGGTICAEDSAEILIAISGGTPPYHVTLYEDGALFNSYVDVGTQLTVKVAPLDDTRYVIHRISDAMNVITFGADSVDIQVNPLPTAAFSPTIRTIFSVDGGGAYQLPATPIGGVFSGPGVVPAEGRFYPGIAGVSDSLGHEIVYTYKESTTGCIGTDTVIFTVLNTSGELTIDFPDVSREGIICYDDGMFRITGNNVADPPVIGSFNLYRVDRAGDVAVPEAIIDEDPDDNMAFIDPSKLVNESVGYRVEYEFLWEGSVVVIERPLIFDYVNEIVFSKTIPVTVCKDESAVALEASPNIDGTFNFSGPGILGNEVVGFTFEPDSGDIGLNTFIYQYTSDMGCTRSAGLEITNFDVPVVVFTPQDVCIPPVDAQTGEGGGPITFTNETTQAGLVSRWMWEFGDINSGSGNFDTIPGNGSAIDVVHDYTAPGNRSVLLKIETYEGCDASLSRLIEFTDKPDADFKAVSDCWIPGEPIEFRNYSVSQKKWETFTWTIRNDLMTWDTTVITTVVDSLARIYFNNSDDTYEIALEVKNIAGENLNCYDTKVDKDFILKPTHRFIENEGARFMTFDDSGEKWTTDSTTNFSSWEWGLPNFEGFVAPPNDNAWFTLRDKGASGERSWIQSECFDFRNLEKPMIRMDVMRSFDRNRGGAVLQYSLNNGTNWQTLGNIGEGINWYNSFEIINRPGGGRSGSGSSIGWSGENIFNPDTSWITVAHDLDDLLDERLVIFGIFYATDGASALDPPPQGFAVDNIYIGERTKRGIVEHFTNAYDQASFDADQKINNFVTANNLDVTSVQYHMHYPGDISDPMNENNPAPASARSFYYGVNQVPYALLDGGINAEYKYNFVPAGPTITQLKRLTLEKPLFQLDLKFQLHSNHLSTTITTAALADIEHSDIVLNTAVVEKSVFASGVNGDTEYRNVVLDMLPSSGGHMFSRSWTTGDTQEEQFTWTYKHVGDYDELMLVAFLQDRETDKILQVVTGEESVYPMNIVHNKASELRLYPNPARSVLFIENANAAESAGSVVISDMTGRIVTLKEIAAGEQKIEINTMELSEGTYIVNWKVNGIVLGRSSFIKLR